MTGPIADLRSCLLLIDPRQRRRLAILVALQLASSVLDVVGVLAIGVVTALATAGLTGEVIDVPWPTGATTVDPESIPSGWLWAGAVGALALLGVKSAVSIALNRAILRNLAARQTEVAGRLSTRIFQLPLLEVQAKTSQTWAYAVIQGASAAVLGIVASWAVIVSEAALLVSLVALLALVNLPVTIGAIILFSLVAFAVHLLIGGRARRLGARLAGADIRSLQLLQEGLAAFRELRVSHRSDTVVGRVQAERSEAAVAAADLALVQQLPRYAIEAAGLIGVVLLAAALMNSGDIAGSAGVLAIFLAATSRIVPSALRLQSAVLTAQGASGQARRSLDLAQSLAKIPLTSGLQQSDRTRSHTGCGAVTENAPVTLSVRDVNFSYADSDKPTLHGVCLDVAAGEFAALVGPSGSGKSTLADVTLGLLSPDSGTVTLDGVSPSSLTSSFPGRVAYMPQNIDVFDCSVWENVAFGVPTAVVSMERVWEVLDSVGMRPFFEALPERLETTLGERGSRLSGGQRQRIGLARALYSRPGFLVIDEATSALDAESEGAITAVIETLRGHTTVLAIAHRLSTVARADKVAYLDSGRIIAEGTLTELRARIPALETQAKLLGAAG